jgi:hypothetical protein
MAFLIGLNSVIALHVLNAVPQLPLKPLKGLQPLIAVGFWVNAITGLILTSLAIHSLLRNWDFYVKLGAIALAIVALQKMRRYAFGDTNVPNDAAASPRARFWAGAMLLFWGLAVLGGRLTAYATNIRIETARAVLVAVVLLLLVARYLVRRANRTIMEVRV